MLVWMRRTYDIVAAVFCTAIVVFYTPWAYYAGVVDGWAMVVGGAALAFWGRRTRIWAGALGGAPATSGAATIDIYAYYQRMQDEGNHFALIADDPIGDSREIMTWFFFGGVAGALIAAIARFLFDPSVVVNWNWPAHLPEEGETGGEQGSG